MKQFSLPLQKRTMRPVIILRDFYGINAMLDTGALFPIWTAEENTLELLGGKMEQEYVKFGGFGGIAEGKLYKLPMFRVGELIYPEFHIISCKMNVPGQAILSATMFKDLRYEIDDENHTLIVNIPDTQSNVRNLRIIDDNGRLHVLCHSIRTD